MHDEIVPTIVQDLASALTRPTPMRRGSVSERSMKCGQKQCRCHQDPRARHGPYYSLTRMEGGKTRSRYLSAEQAAHLAHRRCRTQPHRLVEDHPAVNRIAFFLFTHRPVRHPVRRYRLLAARSVSTLQRVFCAGNPEGWTPNGPSQTRPEEPSPAGHGSVPRRGSGVQLRRDGADSGSEHGQ